MNARLTRVRGLIRKEFLQIRRDLSSIAIAFILPVALLLLFGYGVSLDAKQIPIALVSEHIEPKAADFLAAFRRSEYFAPRTFHTMGAAEQALRARRVDGIVRLQDDFARRLLGFADAPIQVIVDGVDANTARLVLGYVRGIWLNWLARRVQEQGQQLHIPVRAASRIWYNAGLRSRNYLVPGLIAVIMTLIGALLTAMVMAREWERGTLEALLTTPVTMAEIMLGKLIPYFLLGLGGMALSVGMALFLFDVPLTGSFWILLLATVFFLLTVLGIGLSISAAARSQFVAAQGAIVSTFLPAFLLSGFIFDLHSMPPAMQILTYLIPARYFVVILQTVFLAGDIWPVILPNMAALGIMALLFLSLARRTLRKRLE